MRKIIEENGNWYVAFYFTEEPHKGKEAWRSELFHSKGFAKRFDAECSSKGQFRKSIKIPFKMDDAPSGNGFA